MTKHPNQTFSISTGIIDRIVSVPGDTLLLPAGRVERIIPAAGIQIANAAGTEADRISSGELVAVPVPELPIEGGIVREVGGTLLARGVPNGVIVSNRKSFSSSAVKEAKAISSRRVSKVGRISLELYNYHMLIDMLDISNAKLSERMTPGSLQELHEGVCVFDGAAMIHESSVLPHLSREGTRLSCSKAECLPPSKTAQKRSRRRNLARRSS